MDFHSLLNTGIIDLILLVLGFFFGQATKFRTPILAAMLVFRMAKWYMETHPHGKEMAKESNIDESLQKITEEDDGPLG